MTRRRPDTIGPVGAAGASGPADPAGGADVDDHPVARAALNLTWLVFSGLWLALAYALAGAVCCLLVVTVRWGLAAFRLAGYLLWPFGRTVTPGPDARPWYDPRNLLWLLVGGVWVVAAHVALGILFVVSLVAYFFAAQHLKMVPVAVNPRHWTVHPDRPTQPATAPEPPPPPPLQGFRH